MSVEVGGPHCGEFALHPNFTSFEPKRALAQSVKHLVVMTGRYDDAASGDDLVRALLDHLAELVVERLVYLIEQQDIWTRLVGNCEAETSAHSL